MRRRTVLVAAGAVVVAPAAGIAGYVYVRSGRGNLGKLSFRNRLRIPPVLDARRATLELVSGRSEILPGTSTETWGANGPLLGPTLRARRGDRVSVSVTNRLAETTSIHWHGMHLPARMDGGPHQPIAPGNTWRPTWTVDQRAATLWYHPHLHGTTASHVYRGIAGLFLVDEEQPLQAYGIDDVPLVIQDRNFAGDGSLDTADLGFSGLTVTGLLGDHILVNGTYDPYFEVTTGSVRFRLVNGSNARVYHLGFTDGRSFDLVATDAERVAAVRIDRLPLSPGERAEIVVTFRPGEEVVLRSFPPELGANAVYERLAGGGDTFDILKLIAAKGLAPGAPLEPLRGNEHVGPGELYRLRMGDFHFNDRTLDMGRVDRVVRTGATELWEIDNAQGIPHNFHLHGASFQVVDVGGQPPAAHLRGMKDTVFLPPHTVVRLAVRFLEHSDPRVPYMYHCHLLAHEDAGMMGQFLVVDEGDAGRIALPLHNHQPPHPPGGTVHPTPAHGRLEKVIHRRLSW